MEPVCLDERVLPAAIFNEIPSFEQQVKTITTRQLHDLGQLFVDHHLENELCIGLLHRHFDMRDGEAMLHDRQDGDVDMCYPVDATLSALSPHSIMLNSNFNFQAYEFAAAPVLPTLRTEFLHAVRSVILSNRLQDVLAIVAHPGLACQDHPLRESVDRATHTLFSQVRDSPYTSMEDAIEAPTNWSFSRGANGTLEIHEVKICVKNVAGVHEVKD